MTIGSNGSSNFLPPPVKFSPSVLANPEAYLQRINLLATELEKTLQTTDKPLKESIDALRKNASAEFAQSVKGAYGPLTSSTTSV